MLLKLEMKFADYVGNPVRTCLILKCHKHEGDQVNYGDPLFDIQASEVLIPSIAATAWDEARWLDQRPSEIAELAAKQIVGEEPTRSKVEDRNGNFAAPKTSLMRITATDKGIVRKLCVQEREKHQIGDLLALVATDERDTLDGVTSGAVRQYPAFRVTVRVLQLDVQINMRMERVRSLKNTFTRQYTGRNSVMFWSEEGQERRFGIFAKGGCDLPSVMACKPLIETVLRGTCCIMHEGSLADARNDLLLQTLRTDLPRECTDQVIANLRLHPACFESRVFQKSFVVDGPNGPAEFPLTVVILGSGSDLTRTLYRHREYGFLVDPGGGWLQEQLEDIMKDLTVVSWFRRNFVSVGKVTVEQYKENLSKVIENIRQSSGAHVLVFNNPTLEPNCTTHNHQFLKNPETTRRLEFKMALTEVSQKLSVPMVDVDRIVKKAGIRTGRDWSHFHPKVNLLIADCIFGILRDLKVF